MESKQAEITRVPGKDGRHVTYCRICEALCGMVATVRDGKIVKILPDRDNPHSRGHMCVKGPALADVAYDTDRVTRPMRRTGGPGEFEPVSWDAALTDIVARLTASLETNGPDSLALNTGNPPSMGWPSAIGMMMFRQAMGNVRRFGPSSEDITSSVLALEIMFGSHGFVFPDLVDCDHLLIFGSNPLVSHGSLVIAPRMKEDLDAIAERGRVIVVDPRLTETARKYEHVAVLPDGDVWLLGAMVRVIVTEGLADAAFVAEACAGLSDLADALDWLTPDVAEPRCGVAAETIVSLARDFATKRRAAAMGRIGICRGSYSTLTNFLLLALNIVSGKFHSEGGIGWGHGASASDEQVRHPSGVLAHNGQPSRVSNIPSVMGSQASLTLGEEMTTPGPGQIRSLFTIGANPVMSMPNGEQLPEGFAGLELMVSIDLYMTETSRHAHYILPATTALEREDINQFFLNHMVRPFVQHVAPVIPPVGEARMEYDILREIAERMGRGESFGNQDPFQMADASLQAGVEGRDGLTLAKVKEYSHGMMIERGRWAFDYKKRIGHTDGKIHLWDDRIGREITRLKAEPKRDAAALRFVNLRKLRSINSWMHNVAKLVRNDEPRLLIHPEDAGERGIADQSPVRLSSEWGEIEVTAQLSDAMRPGCVAYPHGWGHIGSWQRANAKSGININKITPSTPSSAEQISGMSYLEGFDVKVAKI